MPRNNRATDGKAKAIALSGMLSAVAVLVMLMGNLIPIAMFTAPALAGCCFLPILLEIGPRPAWTAYGAVAVLCLLLVPDIEMRFFFLFLLGYYPILHSKLGRIRKRAVQVAVKLLLFNGVVVGIYAILLLLLASPALVEEFAEGSWGFWLGLLVLGNVTFVMYDLMLTKLKVLYIVKVKGRFFR